MSDVTCELRNEVQMSELSWCVLVRVRVQGIDERLVVSVYVKLSSFNEMSKMFDG